MQRTMRLCGTALVPLVAGMLAGCSPERVLGSNALPPDVPDPTVTKTPEGAIAAYRGAVELFRLGFGGNSGGVLLSMSLLTDELGDWYIGRVGQSDPFGWMPLDARQLPEQRDPQVERSAPYVSVYGNLQRARGQMQEALGALNAYAPNAPPALRGRLYALEGYTEILLADFFCSGVPLSTLDFERDYTLAAGSTTHEVYQRAVAHFDSALALSADSADVMNLARVGKARALLALADYAGAAEAVADVPDDFRYAMRYSGGPPSKQNFATRIAGGRTFLKAATVMDRDGGNGLPYVSSGDPRTKSTFAGRNWYGMSTYWPTTYAVDGSNPIVFASGVEARLVEAEAQLDGALAGDWLATLNALRTDGTFDTQQDPVDTTKTDTLWHAGTGGVAGLRPLDDPGTPDGRLDLVFQERGYWLFLTGHRQGDLRRLIREYDRLPEQVYPTGSYAGMNGRYGTDVNAPVPAEERLYNPKFTGCINRGA